MLLSRLLEAYAMALAVTGQHAEALQVSDRALQCCAGLLWINRSARRCTTPWAGS
ncbi:hypothetical protein V2I01_26045 [Micromonospora sp. BRA006-A]|nr:hypothetical protein [Micromonospora sp. BRA006-A]